MPFKPGRSTQVKSARGRKGGLPPLPLQAQLHEGCTGYRILIVRFDFFEPEGSIQSESLVHLSGQRIEPHPLVTQPARFFDNLQRQLSAGALTAEYRTQKQTQI